MSRSTIKFFAYQWSVKESEESTLIRIYGFTKNGKSVFINVDDYTPYCYIELPDYIEWTESKIQLVTDKLSSLNKSVYRPIGKEFCMKKKLYFANKIKEGDFYKDKLFPFLMFKFRSSAALKTFFYTMKKNIDIPGIGDIKFNVHEAEGVSPVLKLFALKKLPSAGWIQASGSLVSEEYRQSSFDIEMDCGYKKITPINDDSIIKPKLLSFDIEANSTITTAMPDASKSDDRVFQIGCVTMVNDKVTRYLLSLGNPDKSIVGNNVTVYTYKTEADLLVGFADFIRKGEYNVIIGFNILGWDFQYMISRAKYNSCMNEFNKIGCINGESDNEVAPQFESRAYNAQKLVYLDSEGRLYIDLLPIIRRQEKIVNYKLKTILEHFGLQSKDPLSPSGIFECYRKFTTESLGIVGKYCVTDAFVTLLLYEKIQMWFGLCEMAKTAQVPIFYLYSKGTQIQMYSQVLREAMYDNKVVDSNSYILKDDENEYMGAIVLQPIPGKYNKVLSFDFASLYPSIMLAYNIDYSTFVNEPCTLIIGKFDNNDCITKWTTFPCVIKLLNGKNTVYDGIRNCIDLEYTVDKIRAEDKNSMILVQSHISSILDIHCHVFYWEDHSSCSHDIDRKRKKNGEYSTAKKKVICGKRYYRFMKSEYGGKGVIPVLLESHLTKRKETRKKIKINEAEIKKLTIRLLYTKSKYVDILKSEIPSCFEDIVVDTETHDMGDTSPKKIYEEIVSLYKYNQVLDKRQLAYKICANSMYGATGVKKGFLPLMPAASTITYRGRMAIEFISTYIPKKYNGITVYGDTDSSHIYFPHIKNNSDAISLADAITDEMVSYFPPPMKLEFEKIYEKYIILTKKRYIAQVANRSGEIIDFIKRGVVLSRRDNMKVLRDIYYSTSIKMLDNVDRDKIIQDILDCINSMFQRKYSYKEYCITKSMARSEYKAKTLPAHVQLANRLKSRGIPVAAGSRIEYILTDKFQGEKDFSQGDIVEDVDYFKQWRSILRVGYLHYLEKQFMKPLDELLNVGLGIENFVKNQFNYRLLKHRLMSEIKELYSPKITIVDENGNDITHDTPQKPRKKNIKKSGLHIESIKDTIHRAKKSIVFEEDSDYEEVQIPLRYRNIQSSKVDEQDLWKKYSNREEL